MFNFNNAHTVAPSPKIQNIKYTLRSRTRRFRTNLGKSSAIQPTASTKKTITPFDSLLDFFKKRIICETYAVNNY